jgi:hypothetical protein
VYKEMSTTLVIVFHIGTGRQKLKKRKTEKEKERLNFTYISELLPLST